MQARFLALFVVVSALSVLAVAMLIRGVGEGGGLVIGAGGAFTVLALFGIVVLSRFVIAAERGARRR